MVTRRVQPTAVRPIEAEATILAQTILTHFDNYSDQFRTLTARAKVRFEQRQWRFARHDALRRMNLYEKALSGLSNELRQMLGSELASIPVWSRIKSAYSELIAQRRDADVAETFFNSTTRKMLETVGINRDVEFFRLDPYPADKNNRAVIYNRFEMQGSTPSEIIERILHSYSFCVPFEDIARDATRVADELSLYVWPIVGEGQLDAIEMIRVPFFRNRVAYLVGRLLTGATVIPFVLPLYNDEHGILVDAALFRERQVSIIFSFAHTSFCVATGHHRELTTFLRSILPMKPLAELYIAIGYHKHGKTEFYRYLHHYIHEAHHRFWIAPGQEGSVMIAFTLKDFRFVLKVIKDRPCFLRSESTPVKIISRQEVMDRYRNVRHQDHVGRLVDTQEFENLRFKRKRFTRELLREFRLAARESVTVDSDFVTIHHCYMQRRVVPLPLYIASEPDPEIVREIILDFGYFLKDLTSVGIFPTDLFNVWNCGITSRRRVVLFDYDDVMSLRHVSFRAKPTAHSDWEELQREEDRIAARPNDFFIDEMERYLGLPRSLMGAFRKVHGDLFTLEYWDNMQIKVRRGEVVSIIPYDRSRRFENRTFSDAS